MSYALCFGCSAQAPLTAMKDITRSTTMPSNADQTTSSVFVPDPDMPLDVASAGLRRPTPVRNIRGRRNDQLPTNTLLSFKANIRRKMTKITKSFLAEVAVAKHLERLSLAEKGEATIRGGGGNSQQPGNISEYDKLSTRIHNAFPDHSSIKDEIEQLAGLNLLPGQADPKHIVFARERIGKGRGRKEPSLQKIVFQYQVNKKIVKAMAVVRKEHERLEDLLKTNIDALTKLGIKVEGLEKDASTQTKSTTYCNGATQTGQQVAVANGSAGSWFSRLLKRKTPPTDEPRPRGGHLHAEGDWLGDMSEPGPGSGIIFNKSLTSAKIRRHAKAIQLRNEQGYRRRQVDQRKMKPRVVKSVEPSQVQWRNRGENENMKFMVKAQIGGLISMVRKFAAEKGCCTNEVIPIQITKWTTPPFRTRRSRTRLNGRGDLYCRRFSRHRHASHQRYVVARHGKLEVHLKGSKSARNDHDYRRKISARVPDRRKAVQSQRVRLRGGHMGGNQEMLSAKSTDDTTVKDSVELTEDNGLRKSSQGDTANEPTSPSGKSVSEDKPETTPESKPGTFVLPPGQVQEMAQSATRPKVSDDLRKSTLRKNQKQKADEADAEAIARGVVVTRHSTMRSKKHLGTYSGVDALKMGQQELDEENAAKESARAVEPGALQTATLATSTAVVDAATTTADLSRLQTPISDEAPAGESAVRKDQLEPTTNEGLDVVSEAASAPRGLPTTTFDEAATAATPAVDPEANPVVADLMDRLRSSDPAHLEGADAPSDKGGDEPKDTLGGGQTSSPRGIIEGESMSIASAKRSAPNESNTPHDARVKRVKFAAGRKIEIGPPGNPPDAGSPSLRGGGLPSAVMGGLERRVSFAPGTKLEPGQARKYPNPRDDSLALLMLRIHQIVCDAEVACQLMGTSVTKSAVVQMLMGRPSLGTVLEESTALRQPSEKMPLQSISSQDEALPQLMLRIHQVVRDAETSCRMMGTRARRTAVIRILMGRPPPTLEAILGESTALRTPSEDMSHGIDQTCECVHCKSWKKLTYAGPKQPSPGRMHYLRKVRKVETADDCREIKMEPISPPIVGRPFIDCLPGEVPQYPAKILPARFSQQPRTTLKSISQESDACAIVPDKPSVPEGPPTTVTDTPPTAKTPRTNITDTHSSTDTVVPLGKVKTRSGVRVAQTHIRGHVCLVAPGSYALPKDQGVEIRARQKNTPEEKATIAAAPIDDRGCLEVVQVVAKQCWPLSEANAFKRLFKRLFRRRIQPRAHRGISVSLEE